LASAQYNRMNHLVTVLTRIGLLREDLDYHLLRASMILIPPLCRPDSSLCPKACGRSVALVRRPLLRCAGTAAHQTYIGDRLLPYVRQCVVL